jgi:tetratricopeptide (TPR) repeat protein
VHALLFETPLEEIKYLRQLLGINDQSPITYYHIGQAYYKLHQFDVAIPFFEKALRIYKNWNLKPFFESFSMLGDAYHKTGQYKKEKKLYRKAEQYYIPDLFNKRYAILYLTEGDTARAKLYIEKIVSVGVRNHISDADLAFNQALIYSDAGILKKAEEYYRKSLVMEPDNRISSSYFAKFLIENDLNVEEGMELIEKILVLSPDNFSYLDIKGWGLCKQEKYQEALEILQKSWDIRREKAVYSHEAFVHLEAAKNAAAGMK